ncbi:hypothetical protein Ddye_031872 [Dipteronia dyeriana]|uniref:Sm domain-containing protein n=1 Tax=Dipteronia dyeriana TaxID=168575 RepID=A0AAD9WP47_9ROSI|nr:hypothetical protein Ddye_031872 [Dipteronia dyeriana]
MAGRKETVLDLAKFVDKGVQVKLTGGRQVTGTLKGYDQLLNLVLDEAVEFLRDGDDPLKTTDQTRRLGLIVCFFFSLFLVLRIFIRYICLENGKNLCMYFKLGQELEKVMGQ